MKIDMHVHTIFSDGINTPEEIVRYAKKIGLDGIAITDHNTVSGFDRAAAEGKRIGIKVIKGEEVKVREKNITIGEFLVYFIEEKIHPINSIDKIPEIVDLVKEQGGIIAVSHPFSSRINISYVKNFLKNGWKGPHILNIIEEMNVKLDAIEVINGRTEKHLNEKSKKYAIEKKLIGISGSDAHRREEVGNFYTFSEVNDIEEFRELMEKNKIDKILPFGKERNILEIYYNRIVSQFAKVAIRSTKK